MRLAGMDLKMTLMALLALLMASPFSTGGQKPASPAKPAGVDGDSAFRKLPKIWHSEASHKDFRVDIKGNLFHAEWINLPPTAAKAGAYMRIDCRQAGTKWVGSSSLSQEFGDPQAPPGKDIKKLCHLTVRFEVDSIMPEKITFHSEVLKDWDYSKCQILRTTWEEFAWVPKK